LEEPYWANHSEEVVRVVPLGQLSFSVTLKLTNEFSVLAFILL
jgi:hypothetical protein